MKFFAKTTAAAVITAASLMSTISVAQAAVEEFIPLLVYRTGSFAPLGIPWANGKLDYLKMVNERDGGVGGHLIRYEECETGYSTDKGVECYNRLKDKYGGASGFDTQSTGITFAVTDSAFVDGHSIVTVGYGLSQSADGRVFKWNFPLLGNYWTAYDSIIQDIAKRVGGDANLKGKKIALVYHDSPFGKEPIPLLEARAKANGFELKVYPVAAPGVEQKSTWLQIRRGRPDFVLLQSAGIMTPTAIREANSIGYPRDQIYGIWWASSETDVADLGEMAKGYRGITIHNSAEHDRVHEDIKKYVYDKGQGSDTEGNTFGTLAYTRGVMISMLQVEAIRTAQEKFGTDKQMTPEQVRWGYENLNLDEARLKELGFSEIMRPVKTTCENHLGTDWARIIAWDGKKFNVVSDWYQADPKFIDPLVKEYGQKYAEQKNLPIRDCSAE